MKRKKYLILVMDLADTAAGIVFKRILASMRKYIDFDVICPKMDDAARDSFSLIPCPFYRRIPYRIEHFIYSISGYRITEILWADRVYKKVIKVVNSECYDAIVSFVCASNFGSLVLGYKLSQASGFPWVVYSVDALPTPVAWSGSGKLHDKVLKVLKNYLPKAKALFFANPIMLQYEKELFTTFDGSFGVVLTPGSEECAIAMDYEPHNNIIFLYTGYLYGPRKVSELLKGYEKYHKKHPEDRLLFVGNNGDSFFKGYEHMLASGAIERYGFTNRIAPFYNKADVLIDLNANMENDVFLSSKVCNYLSYDKPIITISQNGSPVRAMMSGIESIVHAHHDADEISVAMERAATLVGKPIGDRKELKRKFLPEEIAKEFCIELNRVINTRKEIRDDG